MKYKLINRDTNKEALCDKLTIKGYEYYVNSDYKNNNYIILHLSNTVTKGVGTPFIEGIKNLIATNNPNTDIPKVVDEVEQLAKTTFPIIPEAHPNINWDKVNKQEGFIIGYNKSQETRPFSEEDMKSFGEFCAEYDYRLFGSKTPEQMLEIWEEQRPKIVYYV